MNENEQGVLVAASEAWSSVCSFTAHRSEVLEGAARQGDKGKGGSGARIILRVSGAENSMSYNRHPSYEQLQLNKKRMSERLQAKAEWGSEQKGEKDLAARCRSEMERRESLGRKKEGSNLGSDWNVLCKETFTTVTERLQGKTNKGRRKVESVSLLPE